ncbi:MAG: RAD55 family ATPase [Candidatus Bathyarchaeia archaeon]
MQRPKKLFERLLDSEVKAELLALFHTNPGLSDSIEGIARRLGRSAEEIRSDLRDLVEMGLLNVVELFSYNPKRGAEIERQIFLQLEEGVPPEPGPYEGIEYTGVELIDDMLDGPFPHPCCVLVMGDPGSGKTTLCNQFVKSFTGAGGPAIIAALDEPPREIRASLAKIGVEPSKLILVDCYSSDIGLRSEEEISADPKNPSSVSIAISKAIREAESRAKGGKGLLVFDSMTAIIQKCGIKTSMDFFRALIAKCKGAGLSSLITLNRLAYHPAVLAAFQEMADGVIELKGEEMPSGIQRYARILKMKGVGHSTHWVPYEIRGSEGLVPL